MSGVQVYSFKLTIAYHGLLFFGYAVQPNLRTVQGELEHWLSVLFQQRLKIRASGRTDKGVHAYMQVCSFKVKLAWKPLASNIQAFLTKHVGKDLVIVSVEQAPHQFHAQYSVKVKTYQYVLLKAFVIDWVHLGYYPNGPFDVARLKTALELFMGTHNFLSYSTSSLVNGERTISHIEVIEQADKVLIQISANGFLKSMVRMIIGSALAYSQFQVPLSVLVHKLTHPLKGSAVFKVPSCGLYLLKVTY